MREKLFTFSLIVLAATLLASCASSSEVAFVPSENIEEIVIPQFETDTEQGLPEPFSGTLNIQGETPIFYEGLEDGWDSSLVFPGAVLYHDGLYHMFYNGLKFNRGLEGGGIGYAISVNGKDFFRIADDPILNWDDTVGEDLWINVYSALIDDDGTWTLYLATQARNITEELPRIYRATAEAPNGPWEFDEIPLLQAGETGEWDAFGVLSPIVLKTETGYLMYYENARFDNRRGVSGVGLATSADGLSWQKYNDPATDERYGQSDPIFVLDEEEYSTFMAIQIQTIWQDDQGFGMFYGIGRNNPKDMLYASSPDGITWEEAGEPVFSTREINFIAALATPKVLVIDGQYHVYFYGPAGQNMPGGGIYLASAE
jgi:hypothetical protein